MVSAVPLEGAAATASKLSWLGVLAFVSLWLAAFATETLAGLLCDLRDLLLALASANLASAKTCSGSLG